MSEPLSREKRAKMREEIATTVYPPNAVETVVMMRAGVLSLLDAIDAADKRAERLRAALERVRETGYCYTIANRALVADDAARSES